jgi:flagellar hook-associated protein 2
MSSLSSVSSSPPSQTSGATGTSGITGLSGSGISFQGLVSGINTNQLIQGLLAPEQAVITNLQNQQALIQQHEAAYNALQSYLTALQSSLSGLTPATNSVFDGRSATSSNPAVVSASASSGAPAGQYTFTVNSLAQAQEMSSQGFDSPTSTITQGTFQVQVGNGPATTITIDGSNDTLQGLANAVNGANVGVTATIVNDGSTSQNNRLMLTADKSGTANAITITNTLTASSGSAIRPEFNATYIGQAVTSSAWNGTALPTSNAGSGNYTGTNNDTFTFTVTNGGDITNSATTIAYSNSSGTIKGTISGSSNLLTTPAAVAEGITVQFSSGTVTTGQTFTVNAFTPNTQSASDASVTIGSGSGAVTVTNSSNQIQNLFSGVTLNLTGTSSSPVTVSVANNTQATASSIEGFVSAYNSLIGYINQNDSFDAQTKQAGILLGDYNATSIPNQLSQTVTSAVSGVNKLASDLSSVGISINSDGTLSVNNTTLNQALNGQLIGISANDVRNLFVQDATSSNPAVSYVFAPATIQGTDAPIEVQVTQAATQAAATATNALASSITIGSSNDTLSLSVDGQLSGTVTLASGTYTQAQLAQQVQAAIDASSSLAGASVTASVNGNGQLVLTSNSFGSHSSIANLAGTALSSLGYTGSETATGQDVAGNFIYNGVTEAATGSGQVLTSNLSNKYTGGLAILSTLTPAQVTSNPEGSITVTQGIAAQLNNLLTKLLDPITGQITIATQGLQNESNSITKSITQQQQNLQQQQQSLLVEFNNMETVLAQLQSAGNTLGASLTSMSSPSSSTSGSSTVG